MHARHDWGRGGEGEGDDSVENTQPYARKVDATVGSSAAAAAAAVAAAANANGPRIGGSNNTSIQQAITLGGLHC